MPEFNYDNFEPSPLVRIRPSFYMRVEEKILLLLQQGWPHHLYVVARYPTSMEPFEKIRSDADVLRQLHMVIIDGHHRLEAVGVLQACGYGPDGTKSNVKWVIPTIVLKADVPCNCMGSN